MEKYYTGIDIGSTTIKFYICNQNDECIYSSYVRHNSDLKTTLANELNNLLHQFNDIEMACVITGSGGLELANQLDIPFIQEVIACTQTVEKIIPQTDVAIELGGEDAKITYFNGGLDQRMNGTCAGGTGAFIDQMATLLQTNAIGLNEMAKSYTTIYPIASRCGVFAKTDIQPLINQGARKEDIAASIFQAIVNQTISGLACGKPIKGHIAFLGGPLTFLDQLRQRFIETLHLNKDCVLFPENSQLFVAMGACISAKSSSNTVTVTQLLHQLQSLSNLTLRANTALPPLFKDEDELQSFEAKHHQSLVKTKDLSSYQGNVFLGIDVGSTTSKTVLIDSQGDLLYSFYSSNKGNPLNLMLQIMQQIYQELPDGVTIARSGVTGYGEALIQSALKIDIGEVETIAHYTAAKHFCKDVDFILDIGGQDMKAITIKDGIIQDITLNEACSSGCGSFLETFAHSLGYDIQTFANLALKGDAPVDLGSRCTVFMNSKVKQAQKEGASIENIAAGLAYSIIKNALYKVIKLRNKDQLGQHIVVQGGTFYNDAVLRAFEIETEKNVIRPDIAGLMGAYGMALLAKDSYDGNPSSLIDANQIQSFTYTTTMRHCGKCTNNCLLTVTQFNDARQFVSGNRCERGADLPLPKDKLPNLYQYKRNRIFHYQSLSNDQATRGTIGLPRGLNMYDNYPFWHTLFTQLKFKVVLSDPSSKSLYEKAMDTIPSESVCYPAKLMHGHIQNLIDKGIHLIFYPSLMYERKESKFAQNHFNCPIVAQYSETIRNNMESLNNPSITFKNPFLSLNNPKTMANVLLDTFKEFNISSHEMKHALTLAYQALDNYHHDVQKQGELALEYMHQHHKKGIVLAGRPYHIDPLINHGIDQLITSEGFVVLSEDSIAHLNQDTPDLRVINQWTYHSRLYNAAQYVAHQNDLQLVQLTSFGCGLDAITSDQVNELLKSHRKIYTLIKIDEITNLGAIRIRIRSLKSTIKHQTNNNEPTADYHPIHTPYTKQMKRDNYTILCPQMSPIHFQFIEKAARCSGYNLVVLPSVDQQSVELGLKYVNNDACYPCILVVGQLMNALLSGQYDLNKTALIISQTGGCCRATNYIALIRKALADANLSHIPVISANLSGLDNNPGFTLSYGLLKKGIMGLLYGDLFMRVLYQTRPYEKQSGSANALYHYWINVAMENIANGNFHQFKENVAAIVDAFDSLPRIATLKPRIGLVGEILVKFHPTANNEIVKIIENEGGEAVMPDLTDFFLYCFYNARFKETHFDGSKATTLLSNSGIALINQLRHPMIQALSKSKHFNPPSDIDHIAHLASDIVSLGNQSGEGWFLTGEMLELIESNCPNIICMQPFACLPNHITGKGVIKTIKAKYPQSNIVAIDFDPGASNVNQLNRIKLMFATAKQNLYNTTHNA